MPTHGTEDTWMKTLKWEILSHVLPKKEKDLGVSADMKVSEDWCVAASYSIKQ